MNGSIARILAILAVGSLHCGVAVAETYRWVDEQGNVHYSDRVPPEDVKHERAKLDQQGRQLGVIEGAKTPEQMEQEKRVRALRSEQRRILSEQRDRDLSLLRTYGSEQEMRLTLQNKLSTIDSVVRVTESNRDRQASILDSQRQRAAEAELKGQPVPKLLRDSIDAAQRQIAGYQEQIGKLEADKKVIAEAFGKDIARLKDLAESGQEPLQFVLNNEPKTQPGELPIVSAVTCKPGPVCDKAWDLAKAYVRTKLPVPLVTETEKVLQSAVPKLDQEFSLVATRSNGKTEDTIFLDAYCRPSSIGDELCASTKVREIRSGFAAFIQAGVAASP